MKYLLLHLRVAGILERGEEGRLILKELPHRLVSPGARPTPESNEDVTSSLLLERTHHAAEIHADGARAWKSHANKLKRKFAQVQHNRVEFAAKPSGKTEKTSQTQCLDRLWGRLKSYIPKEIRNKNKAGGVNDTLRQYLRSFVWRHNTREGKDKILASLGQLCKRHNCE